MRNEEGGGRRAEGIATASLKRARVAERLAGAVVSSRLKVRQGAGMARARAAA